MNDPTHPLNEDDTHPIPGKGVKRTSTKPLPHLDDDPTVQQAAHELGISIDPTLDDDIPDGETAMSDLTLESLAAEVKRRADISDERMKTVTSELRRHDAEIQEINTWRGGVLSHDALSDLIDEKWRARWLAIDQEYDRLNTLVSDISGKYGNAAFAMEKVNALEGKIDNIQRRQSEQSNETHAAINTMRQIADTFKSGYIAIFGIDPTKPDLRLKPSIFEDMDKIKEDTRTGKERAQTAQSEVDDLRVILAGFTGQFQGEKGLFSEIRDMRNYFDKKRQREELTGEVLSKLKDVVGTKLFQAAAGSVIGAGGLTIIVKFAEFISQFLSIGG